MNIKEFLETAVLSSLLTYQYKGRAYTVKCTDTYIRIALKLRPLILTSTTGSTIDSKRDIFIFVIPEAVDDAFNLSTTNEHVLPFELLDLYLKFKKNHETKN
ncbi:hypothetical protein XaC1_450 [Xanthomonas phage XaC1]|nr:hypothetical protein XaC1_450 [Xanthomonas phage XaC1]